MVFNFNYFDFLVNKKLVPSGFVIIASFIWPPFICFWSQNYYFGIFVIFINFSKNQMIVAILVIPMHIPIKIMIFGRCLIVLRHMKKYRTISFLLEKIIFVFDQFANPLQVRICNRRLLQGCFYYEKRFLLSKTVLVDSTSYILYPIPMYLSSQNLWHH